MKPASTNIPRPSIWILEDDQGSQFVYDQILSFRHDLRFFQTLAEFKVALSESSSRPQLVLADIRLPDGTFMGFLASSDSSDILSIPFIVVSSVDDIDVLRTCFEEGALDYITKPFSKTELIVRVERILGQQTAPTTPSDGPNEQIILDMPSMKAKRGKYGQVTLTARELQILSILNHKPGSPVARQEILDTVWDTVSVGSKTLDVHIFNLRKKLVPIQVEIRFNAPDHFVLTLSDESGAPEK